GGGHRVVQPGPRPGRRVHERHLVPLEHLAHVVLRLLHGQVGGEAVVDGDHALVGDDVAGHAAAHAHRVQPLVVLQPVDHRPPRLIGVEPGQYGLDAVDGVDPEPRPGAVGALAGAPDVGADRALAAALDGPAGGLNQHSKVGGEPDGVLFRDALEAVQLGRDLLAVVED